MAGDVPLQEHFEKLLEAHEKLLASSDARLHEKIDNLQKLREMDRDFYLEKEAKFSEWREAISDKVTVTRTQLTLSGAALLALIGIIQWWRGSP